jgi:hypothetical protein
MSGPCVGRSFCRIYVVLTLEHSDYNHNTSPAPWALSLGQKKRSNKAVLYKRQASAAVFSARWLGRRNGRKKKYKHTPRLRSVRVQTGSDCTSSRVFRALLSQDLVLTSVLHTVGKPLRSTYAQTLVLAPVDRNGVPLRNKRTESLDFGP